MSKPKPSAPPTTSKPVRRSVMKPPPVSRPKAPPAGTPPVGTPPNPRRMQVVVSAADGGYLKDLFTIFPDLRRPARPPARVRARRDPRVPLRRR